MPHRWSGANRYFRDGRDAMPRYSLSEVFGKSVKVPREVLSDVLEDASNELAG